MDDSPRSSKRRKLDTPTRNSSLQIPKSSQRTPSSRLAKRAISLANESSTDVAEEVSTPTRRTSRKLAQAPNGVPKATLRGSRAVQEKDVYDDIEGALSQQKVSPAPSPAATGKTSIRKRKKTVWDPAKPHPFKSSPSKLAQRANAEEDTIVVQSSNRNSFRDLVNGFKHGPDTDAATQDELAVEDMTPTRRKKRIVMTPNGTPGSLGRVRSAVSNGPSGRKTQSSAGGKQQGDATSNQLQSNGFDGTVTSKGRGRPKNTKAATLLAMDAENEEPLTASPSKTAKSRAPVQESEDELGDHNLPSRTRTARDRRRANRADHTQNRDEESTADADEQVDDDLPIVNGDNDEAPDIDGHSIISSVLDPTEPSPFNKPSPLLKKQDASALLQTSIGEGRPLELLKTIVIDRITRKRPTPLIGLDEEFKFVYQLVENTITAGEGNSMLVIGARGSGKTALVDKVLSEVAKDNREDFHVVRLNGFIHTDDKITLREIWRQLGKEMDVEEDGGVGKNYADTLTTLLALLSHPSEQTDEATDQVAKAVVFVMDEFDLFATHPRQTLLYNLFDIAQSRKAPIAVLGLTTRIDVVNSLEKRVKSRFSHRYVHLSLAKTFTTFQEICKASLLVQPDQLNVEERAILTAPSTTTPSRGRKSKETKQVAKDDALSIWNMNIAVSCMPQRQHDPGC
jgi:origin recognition complex subunit 4